MKVPIFAWAILVFALSPCLQALDVDDVVRLMDAKVSEETIVRLIEGSPSLPELSIADILLLQSKGVSDKVIRTWLLKGVKDKEESFVPFSPNQSHDRPLSSFDRFFLSLHYSHDYGWPKPNYKGPAEILEAGLFYRSPQDYPEASRVRTRGYEYSSCRKQGCCSFTISPFTRIVRRSFSTNSNEFRHESQDFGRTLEVFQRASRFRSKASPDWTPYFLEISNYIKKSRVYPELVGAILKRVQDQEKKGKKLDAWIRQKFAGNLSLQDKRTLASLKKLVDTEKLDLSVDGDTLFLFQMASTLEQHLRNNKIKIEKSEMESILSRLRKIDDSFQNLYANLDTFVFEFELQPDSKEPR